MRKGSADAAGDGQQVLVCDYEGSPRRAGGQVRGWGPRWAGQLGERAGGSRQRRFSSRHGELHSPSRLAKCLHSKVMAQFSFGLPRLSV